VISWEAQGKPARCISCRVLRDQRHVAEIFKLGNPQAKMDYLETQKKLLLVSKIVDKNKKPSSGGGGESESEDGGGTKHKTTGLHCLLTWRLFNPNEVSQYTIESTPTILRKNS
jgi:hypothetical protein